MNRTLLAAVALAASLPFASAGAQACVGLPQLATRPSNLLVDAQFSDGARAFGGRFGFGSSIAFGGIGANIQDYDDVDGTGFGVSLDGGLSILTGASRNVVVCPVASLGFTKLPSDLDASTTDFTAGLALGGNFAAAPGLSLVPFGQVSAAFTRFNFDDALGVDDEDQTETYGLLGLGLGLQLSGGVIIRPAVTIPFGLDDSNSVFSIGVAFPLGRR